MKGKVKEKDIESGHFCPQFQYAVELIGRRWTGAILRALLGGVKRFSDLRDVIPDLSEKMLSERLKELEVEEILYRDVYPETPVRIEYRLTAKGQDLAHVIAAIGEWSETWLANSKG